MVNSRNFDRNHLGGTFCGSNEVYYFFIFVSPDEAKNYWEHTGKMEVIYFC